MKQEAKVLFTPYVNMTPRKATWNEKW